MKKYLTPVMMFITGGSLYVLMEILWRHHSHWSMFLAGGGCFTLIDWTNKRLKIETPLWVRCSIGAAIITGIEFISGCCVNLWAQWNVWDYSRYRVHFLGQICLLYTVLWFFLTAPVIWLAKELHGRFDRFFDRWAPH